MYEFIKGTLIDKDPQKVVVETHGIGYRLSIPLSTYTRLPSTNAAVELFLSHVVREDSETLYAFLTKEERNLFELVTTVSGIGPKTGIAIIGHIDMNTFRQAISTSDIRLLSKIPGIGKKTAERLVIEMRDKFKGVSKKGKEIILIENEDPLQSDAFGALINLGYAPLDAQKALQKVFQENQNEKDLGKVITLALQKI